MNSAFDVSRVVRQRVALHVRRIRASKSMTQESLAGCAGLAFRHIQKIEAAEVNLTLNSLLDCCDLSHAGDFALKRPINASSALRLLPPDRREA